MSTPASLDHFDQVFEKITQLPIGSKQTQFEDCTFKNSDLSEANFYGCNFVKCTFINCNLSMVKFAQIGLDNIQFTDCKMVGADFSNAKDFLFGINFSKCILDYAAFMKKKNRKAKFENCSLKGADFSEADLTDTKFINCDFDRAIFMQSTLNGANFSSSFNYVIDPEKNTLRKAKFAQSGLAGLLTNYGIIVAE
ncbi:pentapeptide repeat-containing protein [Pedobacter cryotolerans]|uniref:Pentapeptide repeat-containing protein n=1 Tax=Pedobacter cryotolerans TaxID=2571270 RepID=A0A4U1C6L0_9SPHI|nr:pentapeptide repeat-containing protein [Pedobacter cryotolerans]TKC01782.1 pentapeptide repeat-containing protein [Pedobacter cryotolerans]